MDVLHAIEFGDSSEADAPLVLLHALGADASSFSAVVEYLKYPWVILVNLPGHGGSAPLATCLHSLETPPVGTPAPVGGAQEAGAQPLDSPAERVFQAILRTLAELGVTRFHLGGISIGGMLTWYGATHYPQQVLSATVLCAGPVNLPATQWVTRAARVRAEGVDYLVESTLQRWFTPHMFANRADEIERVRAAYRSCLPEGYAQCCEVLATLDLREVAVPAGKVFTLAAAQYDAGFSTEAAQAAFQLLEALDSPDKRAADQVPIDKVPEGAGATAAVQLDASQVYRHLVTIADAAHQAAVEQPVRVAEILEQTVKLAQSQLAP